MKKIKQGPKKVSNMLKTLMVVICEMSPHNNYLNRLYSCPQNRFQISAKCCLCCEILISKIFTKSSLTFHRCTKHTMKWGRIFDCPHQIIFSPAALCVCINTMQRWWPVVWPRLQWDVQGAIKACDFCGLFTDWPNFSRSLPELSLFILWVCSSEGSLPVILHTLVDTWDFLKTCNFQDCTIKKPGGEPNRMEETFILESNDVCGDGGDDLL